MSCRDSARQRVEILGAVLELTPPVAADRSPDMTAVREMLCQRKALLRRLPARPPDGDPETEALNQRAAELGREIVERDRALMSALATARDRVRGLANRVTRGARAGPSLLSRVG